MTFNNNLPSEVEIRALMRKHKVDRSTAISLYLQQRLERLA